MKSFTNSYLNKSAVIAFVIVATSFVNGYGQTVIIEPPTDDARVYEFTPTTNAGSSNSIEVGDGPNGEFRALIKWDLSTIPSCTEITSVEIRLDQWNDIIVTCADIRRIVDPWSENTVTWNNQPGWTGWYGVWCFQAAGNTIAYPTDLVPDWRFYGNEGMILIKSSGTDWATFDSKEMSSADPRLTVTYTPASFSSVTITDAVINDTCELTATPNNGTSPYKYQWSANIGNQTNQTATSLLSGTYTVTVTDYNACTVVENFTLVCVNDIEEMASVTGHAIYPNPTTGVFTVQGQGTIRVFDLLGNLLCHGF